MCPTVHVNKALRDQWLTPVLRIQYHALTYGYVLPGLKQPRDWGRIDFDVCWKPYKAY